MTIENRRLSIERVDLHQIIPYVNNAKEHPREQIDQIKKSIEECGYNDLIAIDEENVIIEGHGRWEALREMGYEEIEVLRLPDMSEEQKKKYRILHNKLTMNTDFDLDVLEKELAEMSDDDKAFFGFDIDDIELDEEEEEEKVEIKFTESLDEKHNYLVLYFDNEVDWLQAQTVFGVERVKEYSTRKDGKEMNKPRVGVGRVINGASALAKVVSV